MRMNAFFTAGDPNSWLRRFAFRFLTAYLLLFNLPFPVAGGFVKTWPDAAYLKLWQAIVAWVGRHWLGLTDAPLLWLNSNSVGGWIRVWCCLVLSFCGAFAWAWFDARRRRDPAIHEWTRVYVRYVLVAAMLTYGLSKVFATQFLSPNLNTLVLPVGELSPQELLWAFMGYSTPYQVLAGLVEVVGALLLLSRRTTPLGALFLLAAMSHVVLLNLCYDVEVKLYSLHLLLFTWFLLAPDLRRLADLLVFNRPTEPAPLARAWPAPWMARTAAILKAVVVAWLLGAILNARLEKAARVHTRPQPELHGLYNVESFMRDGQAVAPLPSEPKRWRRVAIANDSLVVLHMDDTSLVGDELGTDPARGRLTFDIFGRPSGYPTVVMAYSRPQPDQVRLQGQLDGVEISVLLRRMDDRQFPLLQHRFQWTR
jgi:uncharacterized membrane protein YphA (DoxX/SURF4 family)